VIRNRILDFWGINEKSSQSYSLSLECDMAHSLVVVQEARGFKSPISHHFPVRKLSALPSGLLVLCHDHHDRRLANF